MAPEKSPAFQFYPKDYLTDPRVRAMSFDQRGLYWEAISICWLEGSLPADLDELAAIIGYPRRRLASAWPRVAACFQEHAGRLTHKRLDKERKAQSDSRDRRAAAARARWEKEQGPNAMQLHSTADETPPADAMQCSPSSSASSSSTSSASSTAVNGTPPIIHGEATPRGRGKIHSEHVAGFCDWVCLPEFIFNEFTRKSAGPEYVMGWARRVREQFENQPIGDNLKFWRARWADSHPEKATPAASSPEHIERMLAIERGERRR